MAGRKMLRRRARLGLPLLSACLALACAAGAQPVDRSKSPAVVNSADGFTISRLGTPPKIDGISWIEADKIFGPTTANAPNGQFTLTLEESKPNENTGDLAGFRLYIAEDSETRVEIGPVFTNYVFITRDSRWVFTLNQLHAIDVVSWRQYNLRESLHVDGFIDIRAVSADGRRLFFTTQPCPFDCGNVPNPDPYYEILLP